MTGVNVEQLDLAPDQAEPAAGEPDGGRPSQATILVGIARDASVELFTAEGADDAYARFPVGEHLETWPLKARAFRRWLAHRFYQAHDKTPGSQAIRDALGALEGRALFGGARHPVAVRVAWHDGAVWLDLGDPAWRAVEVTGAGWRTVESGKVPVRFRRPAGLGELPAPVPGGTLERLRRFANTDDDGFMLAVAWLVMAARPIGPYPVLNLLGVQGAAKTTTARALRALIDPNTAGLRCEPRDLRDLAIAANNGHVVGFDNLSVVKDWQSDALCRLATGGGFATRELYSNAEEALFDFQRPVVLTGIEELAVRGDLMDRSLLVDLPAVAGDRRQPEDEFWRSFEQERPRLLGALLDAVSCALRHQHQAPPDRLPRMADFAKWVVAAAPALPFGADEFLRTYAANREGADALAVEHSPVAMLVTRLTAAGAWQGTATELLAKLNELAAKDAGIDRRARAWPKDPTRLSGALRRVAPVLANVGVRVVFPPRSMTARRIVLEKVGKPASSASSASSLDHSRRSEGVSGDDAGDDAEMTLASSAPLASSLASSGSRRSAAMDDADDADDAGIPPSSNGAPSGMPPCACDGGPPKPRCQLCPSSAAYWHGAGDDAPRARGDAP